MQQAQQASPFHQGEREIQERLGVREGVEEIGQRFIRDHMPDQHREFYQQLPMVLVGSVDSSGQPWASVLTGQPGFMETPDDSLLRVNAVPPPGDRLNDNLSAGSHVGILGIEYQTRRRNRLSGHIEAHDARSLDIRIDQAFGNCPQYIQVRKVVDRRAVSRSTDFRGLDGLDDRAREIIEKADHFYITSHYDDGSEDAANGADVSHRGGKPGFVCIDGDTLTYPEFPGNNHFNTLGNLHANPVAGLLFVDFGSGDLLQLACSAEILWDSEAGRAFAGAERLVRLTVKGGRLIEGGMKIAWAFEEFSPSLGRTGSWEDVRETLQARREGNVYHEYVVERVEPESETISSYYLSPKNGRKIHCHRPGQFLPIEICRAGDNEPLRRTYTISNAPNGEYYRLSIKRERAPGPGLPPGAASNTFHDEIDMGSTIRALTPRGTFTLDTESVRPVVLLSAGVGITPMLSMMEQLAADAASCGCTRRVWFVHGAHNGREHAFADKVRKTASGWPALATHFRYSRPHDEDREGIDFDSTGHVDGDLLRSLLPLDDYDFYLCGPTGFLENLYESLLELGVAETRIHYELFQPGSSLLRKDDLETSGLPDEIASRGPVPVLFARSGIETTWDPDRGTLLDVAESEGLRPAYSCRSGICQTCSTRVVEGTVDYTSPPMAEPGEGDALICCGYPGEPKDGETVVLDL